jgi:hypothetical protein
VLFSLLFVLFSGLLLGAAWAPTVAGYAGAKALTAAAPVEEEQHHAREVLKSALHEQRNWSGSNLYLDQQIKARFNDRDEAVPDGPSAEVPVRPPRMA